MESKEYQQGKHAYSDDKTLADNPYSPGTAEYADWNNGYEYAERNDPLADLFRAD